MAGGRITIEVGLETRGVAKGAKDAEKALENLEDAVKDTGTGGARDLDKLEDELKDVQRQSARTGRDVGKNLDDGFDKAKKGADDLKQEANSTARETAASFDGSAESIGDAFQEVAANAFSGFGPAGAVAGLAAAAGIGLVVAGFEAADEASQLNQERVAEWADAYIEAGGRALTAGVMAARAQAIITDPEKWKQAEDNAKTWGVSIDTAFAAMTGSSSAIGEVEQSVRDMGDALESIPEDAAFTQGIQMEQAYNKAKDSLAALTGEMKQGQSRASILNRYYEDLINSASGAAKEVDELGNELYTLPDGTQVLVSAETGQATQNIDAFKGDVDGVPEQVTTKVKVQVDDTAWRNWVPKNKQGTVFGVPGHGGRQILQ